MNYSFLKLIMFLSLVISCQKVNHLNHSRLASISIGELGSIEYSAGTIKLENINDSSVTFTERFSKGETLEKSVPTGSYRITLNYFSADDSNEIIYASDICGNNSPKETLNAGRNQISVTVYKNNCEDEISISSIDDRADVSIDVSLGDSTSRSTVNNNPSCLKRSGDPSKTGKYKVQSKTEGRVKIYYPEDLPNGCKVPVLHFSNGTGASCGIYKSTLKHWASHGFISTCYESSSTGSGKPCMDALSTAIEKLPQIADSKRLGSSGHSQGGGAAITCTYLLEQKYGNSISVAAHAVEPAHGMSRSSYTKEYPKIKSPVFMFSGSADFIVPSSWVARGYNVLKTETYWYQAEGVTHMNPQNHASESGVSWFRWKLLGDKLSKEEFLSLPESSKWRELKKRDAQ